VTRFALVTLAALTTVAGCADGVDESVVRWGGGEAAELREGGDGVTVTLGLDEAADAATTVVLVGDGQCEVAPGSVEFGPGDGVAPVEITLTAVDDLRWEGDHGCSVWTRVEREDGAVAFSTPLTVPIVDDVEVIDPAEWFLLGVNYPWFHYGHDFGDSGWGYDGVATTRETVDAEFAEIAGAGVRIVRWFTFADGRAAPEFDGDGVPTGLDEQVFADLDAALELAEAHGLFLVPVLLDFWWLGAAEFDGGVQMGGHAGVIADPDRRQALLDTTIEPVLRRYGHHPHVLAWEVINEPEWAMDYFGLPWLGDGVEGAAMVAFVEQVAALIHEHTWHLATVGSADVDWLLEHWADSSLDLLQFHHYDDAPFAVDVADLDLASAPVVGEFPTQDAPLPLTATLDLIHGLGHGGAWPWAYADTDDASDLDLAELRTWAQAHADEVDVQLVP